MNNTTKEASNQERKSMRERYDEAKRLSMEMGKLYWLAGMEKRGNRMHQCGSIIKAGKCPKCGEIHSIRIDRACYMRLCAICAMRRSRAVAAQGLAAMAWIEENVQEKWEPYLITLTQKNVPDGQLAPEIDKLCEALKQLRYRRVVRKQLLGAARTIEVTHNHKARSWHPHIHMIALLKSDGLEGSGLAEAATWRALWKELMQIGYEPQIDVKPLNNRDGAVYEVSKYITKFGKLLDGIGKARAIEMIKELDAAIYDRTLQVWMGIWRQARKALKQADVDRLSEGELAEVAAQCPECGDALVDGFMRWNGMQYKGAKKADLIF